MWLRFVVEKGNKESMKRGRPIICTKKIILSWGYLQLRLLTVYIQMLYVSIHRSMEQLYVWSWTQGL